MIAASNRARAFATPIVLATPAVLAPAVDDPAQHRVDLGLQLVLEFLVAVLPSGISTVNGITLIRRHTASLPSLISGRWFVDMSSRCDGLELEEAPASTAP